MKQVQKENELNRLLECFDAPAVMPSIDQDLAWRPGRLFRSFG